MQISEEDNNAEKNPATDKPNAASVADLPTAMDESGNNIQDMITEMPRPHLSENKPMQIDVSDMIPVIKKRKFCVENSQADEMIPPPINDDCISQANEL